MADTKGGAAEMVEKMAREMAMRQAKALERFSKLLSSYGQAEIGVAALSEATYKLAAEEAARTAADTFELGMSYWKWLIPGQPSVSSPRPPEAPRAAVTQVTRRGRAGRSKKSPKRR
jgi:hypothetical protein